MPYERRFELLWRRLEEAKLRLDDYHNLVRRIADEKTSGAVPFADGNYAHVRGLRAEEVAVQNYLHALQTFKEALLLERAPQPADSKATANTADADGFGITPRERDVLALIASGKSSREIAEVLGIAFKTVATHRYRLQRKLNAHHTADLTRIAIRMGLAQV